MTPGFSTPLLSVDVIPLVVRADGTAQIVLSRRLYEPFLGELALPGVLVVGGETLSEACHRALRSKSGIEQDTVRYLERVGIEDSPTRDERGPTISVAYLAVVDESAPTLVDPRNRLFRVGELPPVLPFDHAAIVRNALAWARDHLWDEEGRLARAALGERFVTRKAVRLVAQLDPGFNTTNGRRLLASKPFLTQEGRRPAGGAGRPANEWVFAGR